jgi:class 3 adenylate cyclase
LETRGIEHGARARSQPLDLLCAAVRGRAGAEPDGREQRNIVTVLFCDVVAYTALGESIDLELTRVFLARYFGAMKAAGRVLWGGAAHTSRRSAQ